MSLNDDDRIRDVWAGTFEEDFALVRDLLVDYPCVALDTEFPGVVAKPTGSFKSGTDFQYQMLKCNVDILRIIQVGLTFSDADGNLPPGYCTFQFHFKFNLGSDTYAQDSINLLRAAGIDFERHDREGIDVDDFGELLMTSGLVLDDRVRWISFHSYYDFGYLLKICTGLKLPADEATFFQHLETFFPFIYDIKYLMRSCEPLHGGLNKVAELLDVSRVGTAHQAGSDSLLTSATFFRMRSMYFEDNIDDSKYRGVLYGLGQSGITTPVPWND